MVPVNDSSGLLPPLPAPSGSRHVPVHSGRVLPRPLIVDFWHSHVRGRPSPSVAVPTSRQNTSLPAQENTLTPRFLAYSQPCRITFDQYSLWPVNMATFTAPRVLPLPSRWLPVASPAASMQP